MKLSKSKFNLMKRILGPRDLLVGNKEKTKRKKGPGKKAKRKRQENIEPKEPDRQGQRSKDSKNVLGSPFARRQDPYYQCQIVEREP